jgi:hypothetical protein
VEAKLGPLGTSATHWPIVPAPGDCKDGEFGGMNGTENRSTRRKPASTPLCSPQIPLDQTRDWTQAAAVGSQRLTASVMARPCPRLEHRASVKRLVSLQFLNLRQSVGLLGRGISPSQGHYLIHTQNKRKHPCIEWDSKCSSGRRHLMPQTARTVCKHFINFYSENHKKLRR